MQPITSVCVRKNFLDIFKNKNQGTNSLKPSSRLQDSNVIDVGSCKRFRIFRKLDGYVLEVYTGANTSNVFVSKEMSYYYLGSFAFTKRFTGEIHKDPIQRRQKRAFNKSKKKK